LFSKSLKSLPVKFGNFNFPGLMISTRIDVLDSPLSSWTC
jgi:hypothetical protein